MLPRQWFYIEPGKPFREVFAEREPRRALEGGISRNPFGQLPFSLPLRVGSDGFRPDLAAGAPAQLERSRRALADVAGHWSPSFFSRTASCVRYCAYQICDPRHRRMFLRAAS